MKTEPQLTVHWWNMGKKSLDFKGSYKEYLKSKDITSRVISHPTDKTIKGRRFKIPIGSTHVTMDTFNQHEQDNEDIAIKIFNMILGDKTLFRNSRGREYKINWY